MGVPTSFPRLYGGDEKLSRAQDSITQPLQAVAQAVSQTPLMGIAPVYTLFQLNAAFVNFNTIAGFASFAPASYYKDGFFRVWAIGVLQCPLGCGGGTAIGTFPIGFRPKTTQRKAVEGNGGNPQAISISPAGVASVEVAIGAAGSCDFDFSFLAEQ